MTIHIWIIDHDADNTPIQKCSCVIEDKEIMGHL